MFLSRFILIAALLTLPASAQTLKPALKIKPQTSQIEANDTAWKSPALLEFPNAEMQNAAVQRLVKQKEVAAEALGLSPDAIGIAGRRILDFTSLDLGDKYTAYVDLKRADLRSHDGVRLGGTNEPGQPPRTEMILYINPGVSSVRLFVVSIDLTPSTTLNDPFTLTAHGFSTPKSSGRDYWSLYNLSGTDYEASTQSVSIYSRARQTVNFIVSPPPHGERAGMTLNTDNIPYWVHSIDISAIE